MSEDDDLEGKIIHALTTLESQLHAKFDIFETRIDSFEKQLAILVQGYAELVAITESLFSVFINKDKDQTKEFFDALQLARQTMLETLQHGIKIAETNADKFVAHNPGANDESAGGEATGNE